MAIRRILVPVDFSDPSSRAIDLAIELARLSRAKLVLLHVVEPVQLAGATEFPGIAAAPFVDLLGEQEKLAAIQLEKIARRLHKKRVVVRALVQTGASYQSIVDTAKDLRAYLIVMGTQGRTGLSHLLIGSVAEKVVRFANCPVVTVGKRKRPAKAPRKPLRRVRRRAS